MNITRLTRPAQRYRFPRALSLALGAALALSLPAGSSHAATPPGEAAAGPCVVRSDGERAAEELKRCDQSSFDALFARAPAGRMPDGPMRGQALRCSACGLPVTDRAFGLLAGAVWHGKDFRTDGRGGHLYQNVGPGLRVIRGEVGYAAYPDDGRRAVRVVHPHDMGGLVTDWLREVRPGVYAGVATLTEPGLQPWRVADFVLYR
ncbi:hypothetical protein FGW37_04415 [Streptomyces rectiverticillatus]|uniref:hypothetical protein n=1 Tax=Streptomyces rectiverticillatus TaxID=173860 RepID=UPI0015C370DA|nr:hypothetical protein [Streptomyces rectiverticillatus]QLE70949.1 hypothetical protein FGW37_04415 [Streptomyces rectiverticillatus]